MTLGNERLFLAKINKSYTTLLTRTCTSRFTTPTPSNLNIGIKLDGTIHGR